MERSSELKTPVGGIALLAEALLNDPADVETVEYFGGKLQKEANYKKISVCATRGKTTACGQAPPTPKYPAYR